jgi:hypothetical protein
VKRRSGAVGKPVKTRRRKTVTLKRRKTPKPSERTNPSPPGQEAEVARLTRELNEERKQRTLRNSGSVARRRFVFAHRLSASVSFLTTAADAFGRQQRERYYAPSGDPEPPFKSDARDTLFRLDDHARRRGICAPPWTSGVGCGAWASNSMKVAFRENEIDDTVLPSLTQEDLKVQARVRAAVQERWHVSQ